MLCCAVLCAVYIVIIVMDEFSLYKYRCYNYIHKRVHDSMSGAALRLLLSAIQLVLFLFFD